MKRFLMILFAPMFLSALLGVSSCDKAEGLQDDPNNPGKLVISPTPGPIETGIKTVTDASQFIPVYGQIIGLAGLGASALLHIFQYAKTGQWKAAALATAQGVNDVVHKLDTQANPSPLHPADAADLIKASVDAAHDGASIPQTIQNVLSIKT